MLKVYISSTYEDLKVWRERAIRAVHKVDYAAIAMEDYPASDEFPLDKCLADVARCHVYVGLIGWRAGFVPKKMDRGITQLEYEHAFKKGRECLIYLLPDSLRPARDDADMERIERFRALVKERHTCKLVSGVDDLASEVIAGLFGHAKRRGFVGEGEGRSLVPYTCDRTPQSQGLIGAFTPRGAYSVPVCALHGPPEQLLHKYEEWLREGLFKTISAATGEVEELAVPWPVETSSVEDFAAKLHSNLAIKAQLPGYVDRATLRDALEARHPYYVTVQLPLDYLGTRDEANVREFSAYFRDWPREPGAPVDARPRGAPLAVLLCVGYKAKLRQSLISMLTRRSDEPPVNTEVRGLLQALDREPERPVALLDLLGDVRESDALEWAKREEVARAAPHRDLVSDVRAIFARRKVQALPMNEMAPELEALLTRERGGREG